MRKINIRKLGIEAREQLRYTAIELKISGETYVNIAKVLGIHFTTVGEWCRLYEKEGFDGLAIKKIGVNHGLILN